MTKELNAFERAVAQQKAKEEHEAMLQKIADDEAEKIATWYTNKAKFHQENGHEMLAAQYENVAWQVTKKLYR